MKILDTDHCIAVLRGKLPAAELVDSTESIGTTAITVGELIHGAHRSARPTFNVAKISTLLSYLKILPFDENSARYFGRVKYDLEKRGMVIGDADLQIAGIALQHQATVVTHNQRHFGRIPKLNLEDWLA